MKIKDSHELFHRESSLQNNSDESRHDRFRGRSVKRNPSSQKIAQTIETTSHESSKSTKKVAAHHKNPAIKRKNETADSPQFSRKDREVFLKEKLQSLEGLKEVLFSLRDGQLEVDESEIDKIIEKALLFTQGNNNQKSKDQEFIDCVCNRYQQITASSSEVPEIFLEKRMSLRYAVALESLRKTHLPKETAENVEKAPSDIGSSSQSHQSHKPYQGDYTIKRHAYNLPFSIATDPITGNVAILFKSKVEKKIGKGGFKIVKSAFFLPKDTTLPGTRAVEASSSRVEVSRAELKYMEMFKGCQGHVALYMVRHYTKKEKKTDDPTMKMGFIMQRYDGSMKEVTLPIETAIKVAQDLLTGLSAMHEKGIVHGDIKPDNFLFKEDSDETVNAVLTDYGLSHSDNNAGRYRGYGTPTYVSPHGLQICALIAQNKQISFPFDPKKSDLWALGLSLLELTEFQDQNCSEFRDEFLNDLNNEPYFKKWASDVYERKSVDISNVNNAAAKRLEIFNAYKKRAEKIIQQKKLSNSLDEQTRKEINYLLAVTTLLNESLKQPIQKATQQEGLLVKGALEMFRKLQSL